ncbi:MAG: ComEC/Rec2 family competence protein, partial [Firmicutes bacterium]|nr:ComEC/Rec2 family competence protein [Bacillota bacterium]
MQRSKTASAFDVMRRRPGITLCVTGILGQISGMWYGSRWSIPIGLVLFLSGLLPRKKEERILLYLAFACFILGVARGRSAFAPYRDQKEVPMDVIGIVQTVRSTESGLSFVMQADGFKIRVRTDMPDIHEGDRVKVSGTGTVPQMPADPGGFDQMVYDGARGVRYEMTAQKVRIVSRGHWPDVFRHRFLSSARSSLESLLPKEQEGAILAILAGDRSDMDAGMTEAFQDCGIAHIIAVSGLHVQVLCSMLEWCLCKVMARKKALTVKG